MTPTKKHVASIKNYTASKVGASNSDSGSTHLSAAADDTPAQKMD